MEDSSSYLMLDLPELFMYTYNIRTLDGELVFTRQSTRLLSYDYVLVFKFSVTSDTHALCFFV